jgi:hypothetical protein
MRQAVTNFILKAYTLSKGKALAGQKVAKQSVHWTLGTAASQRVARFASSISRTRGFEFFLLPSRVHARPSVSNANRWHAPYTTG